METILLRPRRTLRQRLGRGIWKYVAIVRVSIANNLAYLMEVCFRALMLVVCSLAFFLGNTEGLMQQMANALITFSTYPMGIFNGIVRLILFTVVPAGFISFIPLQLLHQFSWPLLAALVGATLAMLLPAAGLFELGLRRYESGNLLGMQA